MHNLKDKIQKVVCKGCQVCHADYKEPSCSNHKMIDTLLGLLGSKREETPLKELLKLDHSQDNIGSQFGISCERMVELRDMTCRVIVQTKPSKVVEGLWNITDKNNEKAFLIFTFGILFEDMQKMKVVVGDVKDLASIMNIIKNHGKIL